MRNVDIEGQSLEDGHPTASGRIGPEDRALR